MTKVRGNTFIEVAQQRSSSQGTLKGNMKKVVAVLLSIAAGSAMASEPEEPHPSTIINLEEVVVTGIKLDLKEQQGMLMMGLSGAYLIHEYDKKRNEWRFIRASNERSKETK